MVATRVVILGGGFGGLTVARALSRERPFSERLDVTVVDASTLHVYTPWLYEVASGALVGSTRDERAEMNATADFSFVSLKGYGGVRFRRARVAGLDVKTKHVLLEGKATVPYDVLVVALGAEPNYFGIPGLQQASTALKTLTDAVRIQREIARVLLPLRTTRGRPVHIVVGGAGPNGSEFAGEVMSAIRRAEKTGKIQKEAAHVTLVDASPDVLMMLRPRLRKTAMDRLRRLGVDVKLGLAIAGVSPEGLLVKPAPKDGAPVVEETTMIPADICVWSGGIKVNRVIDAFPLPKDKRGRVTVDETLQVPNMPGIFVIGDCASVMNPRTQVPDPQTAQVAVEQAAHVAKNILNLVAGKPAQPFPFPRRWETLIALGGKYAVGEVRGIPMTGYLAYLVRRFVDLHYFVKVMPKRHAWKFWRRGVEMYAKNDVTERL